MTTRTQHVLGYAVLVVLVLGTCVVLPVLAIGWTGMALVLGTVAVVVGMVGLGVWLVTR